MNEIIGKRQVHQDLKTLMLNSYIASTTYTAPSSSNLTTAEALFGKLLANRNFSSEDERLWASIGLQIQAAKDVNEDEYAVVSEIDPSSGNGHGFYAIKLGQVLDSEKSKFLQGPHRPSDLYTHEIVFDLLISAKTFGAAAWSTTHRTIVDLCKEPNSYYNSFTRALAKAAESPTILQVHGFSKESQQVDVDVVFSSTKLEMPSEFYSMAECIKTALEPHWIALKYPEEVDFLGGTLNINAQIFYEENSNGKFIHFETSRELRDELQVNSTLKLKITECI